MSLDREPKIKDELTPQQIVESYVSLGKNFVNPPQVKLVIVPSDPRTGKQLMARDIAVTTAVQCYAFGVAPFKERSDEKSQKIAQSTLEAGHHTTRQHYYATYLLEVTRDLAERILHYSPFYNSEQQSQRYVEAKMGNYEIPANLNLEQRELYVDSAEFMNRAYFELLESLNPEVEKRMHEMYPEAGWKVQRTRERYENKIKKISQEVARYVLPIAQKTRMYHTVNQHQILRLFRASKFDNFTDEGRYVVGRMIQEIAQNDPTIWQELEKPIELQDYDNESSTFISGRREQKQEFDDFLKDNQSVLLTCSENPQRALAFVVRNALGKTEKELPDNEALNQLMDPRVNKLLSDVYETGMLNPLTSALRQISFTFATKLSHAAESQRQRHRRTPGNTPPVETIYDGEPDYLTPMIIKGNPELQKKYDEIMKKVFENINNCIREGVPREIALKLLPNAFAIRTVETGDLFDWLHRCKMRLCYLAQEEIFFITLDEAKQIVSRIPEASSMMLAPCGIANISGTGKCPEGDRWCGKSVWNMKLNDYEKGRLV